MIISRTPYRISFFGGGTDYPQWYEKHGGAVISATINKYCYLTCRFLPPFFQQKSRVVWSQIENVMQHHEIQHPVVREVLRCLQIEEGMEVSHTGDLPARSGIGSSSSFTVGLLHALHRLLGQSRHKEALAREAIFIEREVLKEHGGVQDQIAASYGGFNHITFAENAKFTVNAVRISPARLHEFEQHCLLFFTGVSRHASVIAAEQVQQMAQKKTLMHQMMQLSAYALKELEQGSNWRTMGELLHESWQIKRALSAQIAPEFVDTIYARARKAGAWGGKLLGAGGGGFMLFFTPPETQDAVKHALKDLLLVPCRLEHEGTQIIFHQPNEYPLSAHRRRDFYHLKREAKGSNTASASVDIMLEDAET